MEIEINSERLKSDSRSMSETLQAVRNSMESMNNEIQTLNSMWKGASNVAFNTQYASDYEMMQSVCDTLQKLIECIDFASDKYNECEEDVKNIVNSIKI